MSSLISVLQPVSFCVFVACRSGTESNVISTNAALREDTGHLSNQYWSHVIFSCGRPSRLSQIGRKKSTSYRACSKVGLTLLLVGLPQFTLCKFPWHNPISSAVTCYYLLFTSQSIAKTNYKVILLVRFEHEVGFSVTTWGFHFLPAHPKRGFLDVHTSLVLLFLFFEIAAHQFQKISLPALHQLLIPVTYEVFDFSSRNFQSSS